MSIDAVDYALLKCIADAEVAPWKKKVHALVKERADELPRIDSISLQTVGRRIDVLHEEDYIDSCITHAETINRDLIVGYRLTENGEHALHQKREELLHDHIFSGDPLHPDGECSRQEELISLLMDTFHLAEESADTLKTFSPRALATLAAVFYVRQHIDDLRTPENQERIQDLVADNPHLGDLLSGGVLRNED